MIEELTNLASSSHQSHGPLCRPHTRSAVHSTMADLSFEGSFFDFCNSTPFLERSESILERGRSSSALFIKILSKL